LLSILSLSILVNHPAEVLHKAIKEEETNLPLFNFLQSAIHLLDLKTKNYENFHLVFLAELSKYLGFYPQTNNVNTKVNLYFNLQEGVFTNINPYHNASIETPISNYFLRVYETKIFELDELKMNGKDRRTLLNLFLNYYNFHLSNFDEVKSLCILEEVLND